MGSDSIDVYGALGAHYRESEFVGGGKGCKLLSNDEPFIKLSNNGFYKEVVLPGPRTYQAKATGASNYNYLLPQVGLKALITGVIYGYERKFEFNADSNNVYFLKWSIKESVLHEDGDSSLVKMVT